MLNSDAVLHLCVAPGIGHASRCQITNHMEHVNADHEKHKLCPRTSNALPSQRTKTCKQASPLDPSIAGHIIAELDS